MLLRNWREGFITPHLGVHRLGLLQGRYQCSHCRSKPLSFSDPLTVRTDLHQQQWEIRGQHLVAHPVGCVILAIRNKLICMVCTVFSLNYPAAVSVPKITASSFAFCDCAIIIKINTSLQTALMGAHQFYGGGRKWKNAFFRIIFTPAYLVSELPLIQLGCCGNSHDIRLGSRDIVE